MKPYIVIEEKTYPLVSINYHECSIAFVSYVDDENNTRYVHNKDCLVKDSEKMDLETAVIWQGTNDHIIKEVAQMIEAKMKDYNEMAHEVLDSPSVEIERRRRDSYFALSGEIASLYEVMEVVK